VGWMGCSMSSILWLSLLVGFVSGRWTNFQLIRHDRSSWILCHWVKFYPITVFQPPYCVSTLWWCVHLWNLLKFVCLNCPTVNVYRYLLDSDLIKSLPSWLVCCMACRLSHWTFEGVSYWLAGLADWWIFPFRALFYFGWQMLVIWITIDRLVKQFTASSIVVCSLSICNVSCVDSLWFLVKSCVAVHKLHFDLHMSLLKSYCVLFEFEACIAYRWCMDDRVVCQSQ
jgi:hypothetical protein